MTRRVCAGVCALLLAVACRTPAALDERPGIALSEDRPAAFAALEELANRALDRQGLRARARISIDGPDGSARASQRMVVSRPSRMRVEILGLFDQIYLILATDGRIFDVFDAEDGSIESGRVHTGVLLETVGLPLSPAEAVEVVLGAPPAPHGFVVVAAVRHPDGHLAVALADSQGRVRRRLSFDGTGQLTRLLVYDAGDHLRWKVVYTDFRTLGDDLFPHQIDLEFPAVATVAALSLTRVELNPELPPGIFRLARRGGG